MLGVCSGIHDTLDSLFTCDDCSKYFMPCLDSDGYEYHREILAGVCVQCHNVVE